MSVVVNKPFSNNCSQEILQYKIIFLFVQVKRWVRISNYIDCIEYYVYTVVYCIVLWSGRCDSIKVFVMYLDNMLV